MSPTQNAAEKLNTLQFKGFRKILNLDTTYVNRSNTNEFVFKKANEIANSGNRTHQTKIEPLSDILAKRRQTLLGHVLRQDREHPQHQISFASTWALPRQASQIRVGRPRLNCINEGIQKA